MEGAAKYLERHYGGYHPDQAPRWLGFDEAPSTNIYSNFDEFLADPDVELKKKEDLKNRLRGRPAQRAPPKPQLDQEAALGKQLEVLHHCLDNQVSMQEFLGKAHQMMQQQVGKTDLSGKASKANGQDALIISKPDADMTPLPE